MGAHNTLDNNGQGFLLLRGRTPADGGPHCLRLYTQGGKPFLAFGLDGHNPGGCAREVYCPLSVEDVKALEDGAAQLLRRLGL